MPPAPLPRPYRRVNILLFEEDCKTLEYRFGRGWSTRVRDMVEHDCHRYREHIKQLQPKLQPQGKTDGPKPN